MKALSLHVTGIVQGVGFRPFVYNLALERGLVGWVLNASDGVYTVVQGADDVVDAFPEAIRRLAPPMAVVEEIVAEEVEPEEFAGFSIRASRAEEGAMTLVSPDIATCPECLAELSEPGDRRYRYPFINCTNCGPRFTIIGDVPYDRPMTSMRDFPMCPQCAEEYGDPRDRRFHAQPDACFVCGPRVYLNAGAELSPGGAMLRQSSTGALGDVGASRRTTPPPSAELRVAPPGLGAATFIHKTQDHHTHLDPAWAWSAELETSPRAHRDRDAEAARSDAILAAAGELLRDGRILAIKGLGGFHLACSATNAEAVATLRARKRRWGKPLAIMVADLATARAHCEVGEQEAALLTGHVRPIVLLRKRPAVGGLEGLGIDGAEGGHGAEDESALDLRMAIDLDLREAEAGAAGGVPRAVPQQGEAGDNAAGVSRAEGPLRGLSEHGTPPAAPTPALAQGLADNLSEIGVMLPYTPLHHLLLESAGTPLVMTSGNLSDEPIATGNAEALERLASIADAFLLHDRAILSRYDDSVVRVVGDIVEPVRRSRGYAPFPLTLPFTTDTDILAAGPEQKNTFTLLTGGYAFVSQHIGDMENAETLSSFERNVGLYERLFRINPEIIAHDLHPEYLSTKWALTQPQPKVGVQHHHAHIVSVTAEHGISERVVGIAFDGTGYGEDGRMWGGEVLLADWSGYERFAHLAYVPMPGGAAAVRRPARMALGTLSALGLLGHPGASPLRSRLAAGEEATLLRMIERDVNSPLTSSMGRLFDSVAALAGIADDAHYEGEAAILLEAHADQTAAGSYEFGLTDQDGNPASAESALPLIIDPVPVLSVILDDIAAGIPVGVVSMRFHRAVVGCIVRVGGVAATRAGTRYVALAGGVFMNRLVLGQAVRELRSAGLAPLNHVRLPVNDGAVSFGQAVVAWSRRHDI